MVRVVLAWYRVCLLGALTAVSCAKAGSVLEDAGTGVGSNGRVDLSGVDATVVHDMAMRCGDGVCSASIGETCMTCPADCGACTGCPMGYADCAHNGTCVPLNTPMNCGGCGTVCQQVGGTNNCVLSGTNYVCSPTCDATHADCNHLPNDGCEVDITGPNNCGMCSHACTNPNGTTVCTTQGTGWICNPSCTPPYGACSDPAAGCTTNTGNDVDHCGACNRPCSTANTTSRACTNGLCTPTCAAPYSDCSDPAAPTADNGCETNGTVDPGENDNTCNNAPQYSNTNEGNTSTIANSRILPSGDTDTWHIHVTEGSHICFPGTSQSYTALVQIAPPPGANLNLQVNVNSCNNTWTTYNGTGICVTWCGTCSADDSRDWYFQVYGVSGANSCGNYTLTVNYASEGKAPAGCTKPSC